MCTTTNNIMQLFNLDPVIINLVFVENILFISNCRWRISSNAGILSVEYFHVCTEFSDGNTYQVTELAALG